MAAKEKRWRDYTSAQIKRNKERYCTKCRYVWGMRSNLNDMCCGYLIATGTRRGCSPMHCAKFDPGKQIMKEE